MTSAGKNKTSFCIDSLLARDKLPVNKDSSSSSPLPSSSSVLQSAGHEHFLLASGYADSIRFRSNLFGGLHHSHYSMFDPPPLVSVSGCKQPQTDSQQQSDLKEAANNKTTDDRPQSSASSGKEVNGTSSAAGDGQQQSDSSVTCWQQPHSISRMVYASTASSSTATTSSVMTSSSTTSPTSVNYPGQIFASPTAALHAAAAAAAAAVAASSPSAHQFHSAHLEWLARAGVLYHRFGGDLSGQFKMKLTLPRIWRINGITRLSIWYC